MKYFKAFRELCAKVPGPTPELVFTPPAISYTAGEGTPPEYSFGAVECSTPLQPYKPEPIEINIKSKSGTVPKATLDSIKLAVKSAVSQAITIKVLK